MNLKIALSAVILATPAARAAAPADVRFEVRSDRDVRPISALIYGANGAHDPAQNRFGVLRLGGNRYTAYNWENNASNAGSDWQYQNDAYLTPSDVPGEVVQRLVGQAKAIGAAALITIPIVDHVAADKNEDGDVRKTPNHLAARFRLNRAEKDGPLSSEPDHKDRFVYQDEFVSWLKRTEPKAQILFSLDNEPDLWEQTHPQVHPERVGYVELCSRNITFARMIKKVWPSAQVTGPVSYGWNGFTTLQGAPDKSGRGDFLDFYLSQLREAEKSAGVRLVDYLDLHWYPEVKAGGRRITDPGPTTPELANARVQAPRSLWDPTFTETSWIAEETRGPIRLIPRLKQKIAAHYAGTKLAITEWSYGGGDHISGAVATADVLGIFGREGVELATFWDLGKNEAFSFAAFRAFRNYDGKSSSFGDTSVHASSSDPATATLYASIDAANPSRMVLIAINKATTRRRAALSIRHPGHFTRLKPWRLTGAAPSLVPSSELIAIRTNSFEVDLPPMSVSVLIPSR